MEHVTIVIPTFNEEGNVGPLVDRLRQSMPDWRCCVLFVDDSPTPATVEAVTTAGERSNSPTFQVMAIHRPRDTAWGGLGGAVTEGLRWASTPYAAVMDADLQHPPELLPEMLDTVARGNDLVVASRYCPGGSCTGLDSPMRRAVSKGSTWVAKALFPMALRGITDPMTGFYALRLEAIDVQNLRPRGFKILLETLVRHYPLQTAEVALQFAPRHQGDSKANFGKGMTYLRHLALLRASTWYHTVVVHAPEWRKTVVHVTTRERKSYDIPKPRRSPDELAEVPPG